MTPSRHMRRTGQIRGASVLGARRNALSYTRAAPRAPFRLFPGCVRTPAAEDMKSANSGHGFHRGYTGLRVLGLLNFDGLFLTLLCTIRPLSEESLAPLSRGANAFGGLHGFAV